MKHLLLWSLTFLFTHSSLADAFGSVPYYSQYDNIYEPESTCGITSAAMVLSYFTGRNVYPDQLYRTYGKAKGASPEGQASMYKDFGLYAKATRTGTRAAIINHLNQGRIVVIHGWFTDNGHIMPIVRAADNGFIVNDPAGVWKRCARCGYYGQKSGEGVQYLFSELNNSVLSYDGDIWYSVISKQPF